VPLGEGGIFLELLNGREASLPKASDFDLFGMLLPIELHFSKNCSSDSIFDFLYSMISLVDQCWIYNVMNDSF
jgi:hypothetical protein